MAKGSPFDFDIRVAADKRRRGRRAGAGEATGRGCDHPGCGRAGEFRAPRAPDQLDSFLWFCKDHIREYNLRWNFFAGQSEEAFQRIVEADRLWGRATRPFGRRPGEGEDWVGPAAAEARAGAGEEAAGAAARPASGSRRLPASERRALEILDAREHWTRLEIRRQYKSLVKDLHPDLNGGNRADEDRLQEVVWAWDQIKDSRNFRD